MRVVGLMSGTSLDGIDAAVVRFDGDADALDWQVEGFVSLPYTAAQRAEIHDAIAAGGPAQLCRLHARLGEWFAAAALDAIAAAGLERSDVDLIGSHGQTIWHEPPTASERGATLQLGCAATIAERTGIDVVHDFRARDVAAGGHGAPLVPWVDRLLFSVVGRTRVLQNIGGMANLTWVPPRGSSDPLVAFDTGPGNALIDAAVERATLGDETFDRDAHWGGAGSVDQVLLEELLAHDYFRRPPPKSTGREVFGRAFVDELLERRGRPEGWSAWADFVATLTALTARTIADAIRSWIAPRPVDEVIVTGGGARNPLIMAMLKERLAPIPVLAGESLGIDPDAKEAVAFAALAWAHAGGITGNAPEATGAGGPRVLGSRTPA